MPPKPRVHRTFQEQPKKSKNQQASSYIRMPEDRSARALSQRVRCSRSAEPASRTSLHKSAQLGETRGQFWLSRLDAKAELCLALSPSPTLLAVTGARGRHAVCLTMNLAQSVAQNSRSIKRTWPLSDQVASWSPSPPL